MYEFSTKKYASWQLKHYEKSYLHFVLFVWAEATMELKKIRSFLSRYSTYLLKIFFFILWLVLGIDISHITHNPSLALLFADKNAFAFVNM